MPNVKITDLPAAQPLDGSEIVPMVQSGVTVRATTAAIAASPSLTQTFLTLNQELTLPNSRALSAGTGIGLTDAGALSTLQISLNGASGSLEGAGNGLIAKTGSGTVIARSLAVSGDGLSVSDADGVSGNPTLSLDGLALALAQMGGTGIVAIQSGSTAGTVLIAGTANQLGVTNGNGSGGNPTIYIVDNVVLPGTGGVFIPKGTSAEEPVGSAGQFRFNTDTQTFDGYAAGSWRQFSLAGGVTTFSAGSTGFTPSSATSGAITLGGILNPANGGTGVNNGSSTFTYGGNVTFSGAYASTFAFTNTTSVTFPTSGTLATLSGTETLTNKTLTSPVINTPTVSGGSINNTVIGNTTPAAGTFTNLGVNGVMTANLDFDGNDIENVSRVKGNSGFIEIQSQHNGSAYLQLNEVGVSYLGAAGAMHILSNGDSYEWVFGGDGILYDPNGVPYVTTTGTQTLTNKTLTAPVIATIVNTGTLTLPTSTDTLVGRDTTDTLTNKTISGSSNTLSNIGNASLTNSSVTIGSTSVSLGGTATALTGLTSVTVTGDPTTNLQLATKQYVDTVAVQSIHYHEAVKYEVPDSTGNLNATYNNGSSGVGATLTNAGTLAAFAPDGTVASVNDRILIYNQTNGFENGVYVVTTVGDGSTAWVLTRASDADTYDPISPNALGGGDAFYVTSGATGAGEDICMHEYWRYYVWDDEYHVYPNQCDANIFSGNWSNANWNAI